jgi:hypothetical protein
VFFFGAQKEAARKQEKGKGVEEKQAHEEPSEVDEIAVLIPKPSGEPGRPHSGGYSLDDALGAWGAETLSKVTVRQPLLRHDFIITLIHYFRRNLSKKPQTRTSTSLSVMPSKALKKSTKFAKPYASFLECLGPC